MATMLSGQFSGDLKHWVNDTLWEAPASPTVDVPFGSVLNPFGRDVWVFPESFFEMTVVSSGASTFDIGVGEATATNYDNIVDGVSGASTLRNVNGTTDAGTNGGRPVKWLEGAYLNIAERSGAVEGLKGYMHIIWAPA